MDVLIPPLLTLLRSSHLPTTLRTSALSILSQCVATNALALSLYTGGLADSCVELLQLESVAVKSAPAVKSESEFQIKGDGDDMSSLNQRSIPEKHGSNITDDDKAGGSQTDDVEKPARRRIPDVMDTNPTTTEMKAAPLRRAALHFLSQLLRAHISSLYNARSTRAVGDSNVTLNVEGVWMQGISARDEVIPAALLRRAGIVLGYVGVTDEDGVVRVMAREASDLVDQYNEACLGFEII